MNDTTVSTMTQIDIRDFVKEVSLDAPWELTELFATMPRCKPQDVNDSCDALVERLARHGVPVEVLMSDLYLSIPGEAHVRTLAGVLRAKPSAFSRHVPDGLEAELVYVPAAYSKSISTLFQKNFDSSASARSRIEGRIVVSEGYATPLKMREFEECYFLLLCV